MTEQRSGEEEGGSEIDRFEVHLVSVIKKNIQHLSICGLNNLFLVRETLGHYISFKPTSLQWPLLESKF